MIEVSSFAVGPIQENAYILRASKDADTALIVDPGDEADRLLDAISRLGVKLEAILLTHCHFDHIGAVAPIATATGAQVWCPQLERPLLADIMRWVPPGFGPYESYEADHTLSGGEKISLAGLHIEVLFTPGHSPGHLTYAITPAQPEGNAFASDQDPSAQPGQAPAAQPDGGPSQDRPILLSGDVLFEGSVGRVDLPGGDWPTLHRSLAELVKRFPPDTKVLPGHLGPTTIGQELDTNPFLNEIRSALAQPIPQARGEAS